MQILLILAQSQDQVITREEIKKRLWPNDTIVEFDHSINTAIGKLRKALDDSADNPRYIETVGRRGYRLMVQAEWVPPAAASHGSEGTRDGANTETTAFKGEPPLPDSSGLVGKKVSHYRVLEIIGAGGMGLVYKAEDLKLGRRVALKFLPEELADDFGALHRFEREARTASSLNHPNICTIHEVEEHNGQPFIVMELLEGETLRDRLAPISADHKTMSLTEILRIATLVCDGLRSAHERGIIHRDIKPANIFLTTSGRVKILDFGLAKLLREAKEIGSDHPASEPGSNGNEASHLGRGAVSSTDSRLGIEMGTVGYMSPEQVSGEELDAGTDIFSFGVVLHEMATGRQAFNADSAAMTRDVILTHTPPAVRELNSTMPARLEEIVNRLIEKNRKLRYQSTAEVYADLLALEDQSKNDVDSKSHIHPRAKWMLAGAVTVAVAIASGLYWRSHGFSKLSEGDTIVLADFTNLTNDPSLNKSLDVALGVALGQTPFLNQLSPAKISQALKVKSRDPSEGMTAELAQEVCVRTNSAAYIRSSITDAGNQYRLELAAVACRTGKRLADVETRARERNLIVRNLGEAATTLRQRLGESQDSLQRFNQPLEKAATASVEALQAYSEGMANFGKPEAVDAFKRALELDGNFALAYRWLGSCYQNFHREDLEFYSYDRAYALRDRLSIRDRLDVEGSYYVERTGEMEKTVATAEESIRDFPLWGRPRNLLGMVLRLLGDYDKSIAAAQDALRVMPESMSPYGNLALSYTAINHLSLANAALDQAQTRGLEAWTLRWIRFRLAFLQQDRDTMDRQVNWAKENPAVADLIVRELAETEAYYGHLRKSDELSERAMNLATAAGALDRTADWEAAAALRAAQVGFIERAKKLAHEALAMNSGQRTTRVAGLALAIAGDIAGATEAAKALNYRFPSDTFVQNSDLPSIWAEIYIHQGDFKHAIDSLERSKPYDLRFSDECGLQTAYERAQALLLAGQPRSAVAEFREVLAHPGVVVASINGPLARLQLARAQAMMGDRAGASKSYQDFLTLWKYADQDTPIYKQAKAEYAKLR